MNSHDFHELVTSPTYSFLFDNEHLKDRLCFVCLSGSHAYGTDVEGSDVDIRGCALNSPSDILGLSNFEQVVDNNTDTTVFAFNKLVRLLAQCNPNVIEMLGCRVDHYYFPAPDAAGDAGTQLIAHRKMFLSQRAAYTFGGYAFSQLRRLENALARDKLAQPKKEEHIKNSIEKVARNYNNEGRTNPVSYSLRLADAVHEDFEKETFITMNLEDYPVRDLKALINDVSNVIRDYAENLHGRNRKKDDLRLNKHAMHMIRLYLMCIDILEKEEIITYRADDRPLLLAIRAGKFQHEDGTFDSSFFDLVQQLSDKMEYAKRNTSLPKSPDMKKIEEFVMDVNRRSI